METMKRFLCTTALLLAAATTTANRTSLHAQSPAKRDVPQFEVDPGFFKLPNGWKFAQVSSVACDSHDNVWVLQRPLTAYSDQKTGPSVMEFDPKGNYLQGWGGKDYGADKGFVWPEEEHGISIDKQDHV